jgi:hypothetical protein
MSSNSLTHVITISIRNTKVKKRNLILQAAVAGLFCAVTLSANATGSGSNAIGNSAQIASQAVTATSVIGSGSLTYTVSGSIPVGNYYVYVQLNQGATFAFPTSGNISATALVSSGGTTNVTISSGVILQGNTSIVAFPIQVLNPLPAASTFTFKPVGLASTDGAITGALAAAGSGALNATMSLGASASYSSSLTAIVSDEASPATGPIATFVPGVNASGLTSASFGATTAPSAEFAGGVAEVALINVLGGATGVSLTGNANVTGAGSLETLDLGGFYFIDVATDATTSVPPFGPDAATTFSIAASYIPDTPTLAATVTGPAGFFNVANQTGGAAFLSSVHTCANSVTTGTINTAGTTATFSFTPVAANLTTSPTTVIAPTTTSVLGPLYVCVQAPSTNSTQWVAGQPSVTATLSAAGATSVQSVSLASTPLYNLQSNGGSAYVREYIPASISPAYTSYIRVINTGNVTANINAAIVSDVTGKTGVTGVIATAVPKGGAVTLSSSQIEQAIVQAGGVAPAGTVGAASGFRPRLFVSAPTTIAVQSFISDAQGNFSEVSGGNSGNIINGGLNYNPFNQ